MKLSFNVKLTKNEWIRVGIELLLLAFFLASDLLSKHFVEKALVNEGVSMVVIDKVLTFIYCRNEGASFSIFSNATTFLSVFSCFLCLAIVVFLILRFRKINSYGAWGWVVKIAILLILAGGLGNLIDRLAFGYVRDFIYYQFLEELFNYRFAICNVADIQLSVGLILVVIVVLFSNIFKDEKSKKRKSDKGELQDNTEQDKQTIDNTDTIDNLEQTEHNGGIK